MPPLDGYLAASWAEATALQYAISTGHGHGDGQQGTGQGRRRCEDHKDAGAEHGAEPDRGGIQDAQPALQLLLVVLVRGWLARTAACHGGRGLSNG